MSAVEDNFAFQLQAHKQPPPIRELPFAVNGRKWRFDFGWIEGKVAVEIEGGTRGHGRHTRHDGFEKDCEKYNHAALWGWRVFRFTSEQVTSGMAINFIVENQILGG